MRTWAFAAVLVGTLGSACFPCPRQHALVTPDGGSFPCTRASECPTENGTLTCTNTLDRSYECIGCESGQCVRWGPEACR